MGASVSKPLTTGLLAGSSPLGALGAAVSIASGVSGLLGDKPEAPALPQAPQLDPADKKQAEGILEDEAAKLRALRRRQTSTQKLFKLDSDGTSDTLLGE